MKIKLRIKRCSPLGPGCAEGYYQAYTIDARPGMTVLDALLSIFDEQDASLGFRRSCRSAICGSCAMTINGAAKLACSTQIIVEYEKAGALTLEPLANHTPLKDLIVDFNPFWRKMEKIRPYLKPVSMIEGKAVQITQDDLGRIDKAQACILCGSCNAECSSLEADDRFTGPAALAKAWRFVGDVREAGGRARLGRLSDDHGVWDCVRCVRCTQVCPKDVDPLKAIERLRERAIEEGITDNPGARHALSMAASVRRVGLLDEAAMTLKTLGFLRSLGMIPFGLKMEMHGKMPMPMIFSQIENIDEVRAIYDECERIKPKIRT
ncbi:MAG: succinate dehydrogenase/fumarate reductase iron-sulfur subunit [Deltaproteobacteria bacterium]|nr:succinate dehydrogenase/fumarate reductase iron-sulfur subunit [Deltaproteobacteria bacterium]